jgi:hypothetical protein
MTTREFGNCEQITAVLHQEMSTGETYVEPIMFGHYGPTGGGEVWFECEGHRVNVVKEHAAAFLKQFKRAMKLAAEIDEEAP